MNRINPAKLHLSKWTALQPKKPEKHFLVVRTTKDDAGIITHCTLEAVHSQREYEIDWHELQDSGIWQQGWV